MSLQVGQTAGQGDALHPRVAALLREVAAQLDGQSNDIALTMVRVYREEIPAYAVLDDESFSDDVRVVSSALVRCWLTVMATGRSVADEMLQPLTEGARRRAAQGVDLHSLLKAYRIGIRVMWREITASPAWRARALQAVLADVATWVLDFADKICTAVAAAYLDETTHVAREREHRRSALLNVILGDPSAEHLHHPDELALAHCVVVAKVPGDTSLVELERTGRLLEERAGAQLWTVRHCSVVAAIPASEHGPREALRQRLAALTHADVVQAVGLGGTAAGPAETRQSYVEAADALSVGSRLTLNPAPVYDYQELAPLIALMSQPERARRFAATCLGPLGSDLNSRAWVLPTVEAYLSQQGRVKAMATALHLHPNTIKYRLNELKPFLDSALGDGDRAATLLLAVRVHQLLRAEQATGETVLRAAMTPDAVTPSRTEPVPRRRQSHPF